MPSFLSRFHKEQSGQSLVEILVGLAIGALLIGTATIGVIFVIKSSTTNQNLGTAADLTKGLLDNVRTFSAADWANLTDLSHGASSTYFVVASGTTLFAVPGEEGVIGNDVTNGLVGHWGLDEGTGTVTYDESGNGHNGMLVNGPLWQTTTMCKMGNCLSFNGTNSYVVDNNGGFLPTGSSPRTIAFWFDPLPAGSHPAVIAYGCSSEGYGCSDSGQGTYVSVEVSTNYDAINTESCAISGPAVPSPQQSWHFYTAVFNGDNTVTFYMDGVNKSTVTAPCTINSAAGNGFSIGVGRWGYYDGLLDDIRVYNRALSAAEIAQLYKSQYFSRYFYVEDVCRTNDASSSIVGTVPCSGSNWDDPLTQDVTAETTWGVGQAAGDTTLSTYLTNYNNFTLRQTDWSGGGGETGPLTIPNNQYASGTNVTGNSIYGSFEIQNLTQQ